LAAQFAACSAADPPIKKKTCFRFIRRPSWRDAEIGETDFRGIVVRWCDPIVKSRFPPDLFVIVFGPVIVLLIPLGLGSLIFHAEQLRGSVVAYALLAVGSVVLLVALFSRTRRQ
jgi:hypothetical protein